MSRHITLITGRDYNTDGTTDEFHTLTVCVDTGVRHNLRFVWDGYNFWTQCHTCCAPLTIPRNDRSHTVIDLQDERDLDRLHDTWEAIPA